MFRLQNLTKYVSAVGLCKNAIVILTHKGELFIDNGFKAENVKNIRSNSKFCVVKYNESYHMIVSDGSLKALHPTIEGPYIDSICDEEGIIVKKTSLNRYYANLFSGELLSGLFRDKIVSLKRVENTIVINTGLSLKCLRTPDLNLIWEFEIANLPLSLDGEERLAVISRTIGFIDNTFIASAHHHIHRFDLSSGALQHSWGTFEEDLDMYNYFLRPHDAHLVPEKGLMVNMEYRRIFWKIDLATNQLHATSVAEYFEENRVTPVSGASCHHGDVLFFGSNHYNWKRADQKEKMYKLVAFDYEQMKIVWSHTFDFKHGEKLNDPPQISDDGQKLYIKDTHNTLHIFERNQT